MLIVTSRSSRVIEDSENLPLNNLNTLNLSHLHIICDIIQLQYIRTATYNSYHLYLTI